MQIRSHATLDLDLAWQRVLTWAQGGGTGVSDRLPYEVLSRVYQGSGHPPLASDHHVGSVTLILASKKSGLFRPLVRVRPTDLLLYQALVDRLASDIEAALPPRDVVCAYRQSLTASHNGFADSPNRETYEERIREILSLPRSRYAITADVAGFFLHITVDEIERRLLSISPQTAVVRDLGDLLRAWQLTGIRGLPHGLRPSSPLGNLFLLPLDTMLRASSVSYVRWMDDLIVAADSFHSARRIQDNIERLLYQDGMSLAADKTKIRRCDITVEESENAHARLKRLKQTYRDAAEEAAEEAVSFMDYPPDDDDDGAAALPDPKDLDLEVVVAEYDGLLADLDSTTLRSRFSTDMIAVLRDLEALKHSHELERIPLMLTRAPDLTLHATRYLAAAFKSDPATSGTVFEELLSPKRFWRESERLDICNAIMALSLRSAEHLAPHLQRWATLDQHALVRARALLAWGAQSADSDFDAVDAFWRDATSFWQPYAFVSIQAKRRAERDGRYETWSGEGRFLRELADTIKKEPFGWRKL